MTIYAIKVNGEDIDLGAVEYDVQITHGRSTISSPPEPSSASIIIRGEPGIPLDIADELVIGAYNGVCRFRGTITDLSREHLSTEPPTPVTRVQAIGFLAKLGLLTTGEDPYSKQTVRQRVDVVMADAGLNYVNAADNTLELASNNEPGIQPKISYLQTLAEWSGGTYFDDCRGRVIFEDYGDRGQAGNPGTWANATEAFGFYTQAWDAFPATNAAPQIPAVDVVWSPQWTKNLATLINDIQIEYKNEALIELTDSGSIARYGLRQYDLKTELESTSDATQRAQQILTAQSQPYWNLGQVTVLVHNLTEPERDRVLALLNGSRVIINGLPEGSPFDQFQGIVEGWSETYLPGRHLLTLSLSDPRASYEVVTWDETKRTTATRQNLIMNPSFETNATGWQTSTGNASGFPQRSTLDSAFGSASLTMKRTTTAGEVRARTTDATSPVFPAGSTVTLSAYVKPLTVGRNMTIRFQRLTPTLGGSEQSEQVFAPLGEWTRLTHTVSDATATSARVFVSAFGCAAGDEFLIDGVLAEAVGTLGHYFDGTYVDPFILVDSLNWDGTPENSTSTLVYYDSPTWGEVDPTIEFYNVVVADDLIGV